MIMLVLGYMFIFGSIFHIWEKSCGLWRVMLSSLLPPMEVWEKGHSRTWNTFGYPLTRALTWL
jgi:hypothetical protein